MRKFILLLVLVAFVGTLSATPAYLLPTKEGQPSEIVPLRHSPRDAEVEGVVKELFKDYEKRGERGVVTWILTPTGGGDPNYVLTGLGGAGGVDTFMTWFEPPAACSLLNYEVTVSPYEDPSETGLIMFLAGLDQTIDYADETLYPEYHSGDSSPGLSPVVSIFEELPTSTTAPSGYWSYLADTVDPCVDIGTDKFGVGWVKVREDVSPNPYIYATGLAPYHTLMYRDIGYGHGWYSSWHFIRTRARVNFYKNPPPFIKEFEALPYTYSDAPRKMYAWIIDFGVPADSGGVDTAYTIYHVNSTPPETLKLTDPWFGDSLNGVYEFVLPAVNAGDTMTYWVEANDIQGAFATVYPSTHQYVRLEGTPGNFLLVDGYDITEYAPGFFVWGEFGGWWDDLPGGYVHGGPITKQYGDQMDYWPTTVYGEPDSSVLTFYAKGAGNSTVLWFSWGDQALGNGVDYGTGGIVFHSDTSNIKELLDLDGNFWYSDQDFGYGTGVAPDYQDTVVPAGHWVREYLGVAGLADDFYNEDTIGVGGNPADPIFGSFFTTNSPGYQLVFPFYFTRGPGNGANYPARIDSTVEGVSPSQYMFKTTGEILGYYYDRTAGGKVVMMPFKWDDAIDPGFGDPSAWDSLDYGFYDETWDAPGVDTSGPYPNFEALDDTLVLNVMSEFFEIPSGITVSEEKSKLHLSLLPLNNPVIDRGAVRFALPRATDVKLSVYDATGRQVKTLLNRRMSRGTHTMNWDLTTRNGNKVANGIYFYRLATGNKSLSSKIVVIR